MKHPNSDKNIDRHKNRHKVIVVDMTKKPFTTPKLHIPKKKVGDKLVADLNADWYVWYRYTYNGKRKKIMKRKGLAQYQTVADRKMYGNRLAQALLELLEDGFNPNETFTVKLGEFNSDTITSLEDAIEISLSHKKKDLKDKSYKDLVFRFRAFTKWCDTKKLLQENVKDISKTHIIHFLNSLDHLSGTSINNYRRAISSVFGTISKHGLIEVNIARELPTIKSRPKKNIPFTPGDIEKIKQYLFKHDPYLYEYIKFVFYGFLRPIEVNRIETRNIDIANNVYRVETKRDTFKTKVLLPQLKDFVITQLLKKEKDFFLFGHDNEPAYSNAKETTRYATFAKRFKKAKDALGFGESYGLYSFRHSAAIDNYNHFKKRGLSDNEIIIKMLPITGHKTEQSLRSYLREIDSNLPTGYETNFSIDF